jgi:uncharacterized protein (DUF302 family)
MKHAIALSLSLALAAASVAQDPGPAPAASGAASPKTCYVVETGKTFEQAAADLGAAVKRNGFGVLHIHDLGTKLREKGVDFEEQCKVFEVCNPQQAGKVLSTDMRLNMALPCRISVYTEGGRTKIGMIRPTQMLAGLSNNPAMAKIAAEVEAKTAKMIDEAK